MQMEEFDLKIFSQNFHLSIKAIRRCLNIILNIKIVYKNNPTKYYNKC